MVVLPSQTSMILFEDVRLSFEGQEVLKGVSFRITENDRLCIVGKSGSGKTLILKLMSGLLRPASGKIWIGGKDSSGFTEKEWKEILQNWGFVFQGAALFDSLNVFENVAMRLLENRTRDLKAAREQASIALTQVGLDENILSKLPSELSGGMQKRVSIARAIIHRPRLMLYDEPTTGLDPETAGKIDRLISGLSDSENRTTVVVTHDLNTIRSIGRRTILIREGEIAFDGDCDEFFSGKRKEVLEFLGRET